MDLMCTFGMREHIYELRESPRCAWSRQPVQAADVNKNTKSTGHDQINLQQKKV